MSPRSGYRPRRTGDRLARRTRRVGSYCGNLGPPAQHLVSIKASAAAWDPAHASATRAAGAPTWPRIAWPADPFGAVSGRDEYGTPSTSSDLAGRTFALSVGAGLRHSLPVAASARDESTLKRLIAFGEIADRRSA